MYLLAGFGVTVGYHRLLTHRSFEAPAAVRGTLAALGSMSVQGAADPLGRRPPQAPRLHGRRGRSPQPPHPRPRGLARACSSACGTRTWAGCSAASERASARRFAPRPDEGPGDHLGRRRFFGWVLLGLAMPFALGFVLAGCSCPPASPRCSGAASSASSCCTTPPGASTRSATCTATSRSRSRTRAATTGPSRSSTLGEGWHHNHHAFPTSARHGLRPASARPDVRLHPRAGGRRTRAQRPPARPKSRCVGKLAPAR